MPIQITKPFKGWLTKQKEKPHGDFQKWLDLLLGPLNALARAVNLLNQVKDLTGGTTDYALAVNEVAKIDITAASTDLHIAVEDGVYELELLFDSTTFSADRDIDLQANNTTYGTEFNRMSLIADAAIATDEVDAVEADTDVYQLGVATRPRCITARLVISGLLSSMVSNSYGITAGSRRLRQTYIWRNGSVAHTILGTLTTGEACTGVLYVKRMA
jgi:hypothetical protein